MHENTIKDTMKERSWVIWVRKILDYWFYSGPMYLAFGSLQIFVFFLLTDSFIKNQPDKLITFILASIGISIALSSSSFTYSRVLGKKLDKELINKCGELFLHAAIKFIIGVLLIYIFSIFSDLLIKMPSKIKLVFMILKGYSYFSSYVFLHDAIVSFHKSLYRIVNFHRHRITFDYGLE